MTADGTDGEDGWDFCFPDVGEDDDTLTWQGTTLSLSDTGFATTGDIEFRPSRDDETAERDLPDVKMASFTPTELVETAQECDACDVLAADAGYTHFCVEHRLEAVLTALARTGGGL